MTDSRTAADSHEVADFDEAPGTSPPSGALAKVAYALGGFGLLAATAADSIAVAGRHAGIPLLGSIELVQVAVVLLASSAMMIVTLAVGHASVHIVTERVSPALAAVLARFANLLSGLVFLALAIGSIWITADLWNGFEQTELLHIPLRWLRLVWIVFALLISARFLLNAWKPAR